MNAELHTLTGAYALNALSDSERAAFEEHLAECQSCVKEVAELQETAARLGGAVATPAPASLRADVLASIGLVRQLPPEFDDVTTADLADTVVPLPRRRWPTALTGMAAAAAVIVAVVLGVQVIGLGDELDRTRAELADAQSGNAELTAVLSAPDARVVSSGGRTGGALVLSERLAKLAFVPREMKAPAEGKAYQMWLIGKDGVHSAGLMTDTDHAVVADMREEASRFGITVEPAAGSRQPTTEPVLLLRMA
ncbi:MAG: anti-sigma factor [Thermocrispum sp.]